MAVLLVIFRHWHFPHLNIEFGWIGVNMFFVLSGFLISSILMHDKKSKEFSAYLRVFFLKRVLRIFPLYFFYLGASAILLVSLSSLVTIPLITDGLTHLKANIVLLTTYTYSFHNLIELLGDSHSPGTKFFGHLWSLSVEEQFYLIFPFIVWVFNRSTLKWLMIAIIVASPILRIIAMTSLIDVYPDELHAIGLVLYKSTLFQLDSLAMGVLLATLPLERFKLNWRQFSVLGGVILVIQLGLVFALRYHDVQVSYFSLGFQLLTEQMAYSTGTILDFSAAFSFTMINAASALVVWGCVSGVKMLRFLGAKWLIEIGKISYGIYIYHNAIFALFSVILYGVMGAEWVGAMHWPSELLLFAVYVSTTFVVASASYRFLEKPFLKWKSKLT